MLEKDNIADIGLIITDELSNKNFLNEAIVWVDTLELGKNKDNEILVLANKKSNLIQVYLGTDILKKISYDKINLILEQKVSPLLLSQNFEKAISTIIVQIIDSLTDKPEARNLILGNDLDLLKYNTKRVSYNSWFKLEVFVLIIIILVLILILIKKLNNTKTSQNNK